VSVKSTGEALAIANDFDVSAQVDDTGVRWSQAGQVADIAA
jgi:hypothetical protein